jgi:hypothetical protein
MAISPRSVVSKPMARSETGIIIAHGRRVAYSAAGAHDRSYNDQNYQRQNEKENARGQQPLE